MRMEPMNVDEIFFKGQSDEHYIKIDHGHKTVLRKFVLDPALENFDRNMKLFRMEIMVLSKLKHPNLVGMLRFEEFYGHSTIYLEYVGRTSLDRVIFNEKWTYTANTILSFWLDILNALIFIHTNGFLHRDVKPSNLFIDDTGSLKLCDFESTKFYVDSKTSTNCIGTFPYRPPESYVLRSEGKPKFDEKGDTYAVGITMWETVMRKRCLSNIKDEGVASWFKTQRAPHLNCRLEFSEIVDSCTTYSRKIRCSTNTAYKHVRQLRKSGAFQMLPLRPQYDEDNSKLRYPKGVNVAEDSDWKPHTEIIDQLHKELKDMRIEIKAKKEASTLSSRWKKIKKNLNLLTFSRKSTSYDLVKHREKSAQPSSSSDFYRSINDLGEKDGRSSSSDYVSIDGVSNEEIYYTSSLSQPSTSEVQEKRKRLESIELADRELMKQDYLGWLSSSSEGYDYEWLPSDRPPNPYQDDINIYEDIDDFVGSGESSTIPEDPFATLTTVSDLVSDLASNYSEDLPSEELESYENN